MIAHAPLGRSDLRVSRLALGSWRTFERMPGDQPTSCGGSSGTSRTPPGSSTPRCGGCASTTSTSPTSETPPAGLGVDEVVEQVGSLIATGKLRAWGLLNWPAGLLAQAAHSAETLGVAMPAAVQLPYSLVRRSPVEDRETTDALKQSGASIVASATLSGGALTGKYLDENATGRIAAERSDPRHATALAAAQELVSLGAQVGIPPAALAIAFALKHPAVASVLVGATTPEQINENVRALDVTSVALPRST